MQKLIAFILTLSIVTGFIPLVGSPVIAAVEDDNNEDNNIEQFDLVQASEGVTLFAISGEWSYSIMNGSYARVDGYTGTASSITIPGELGGYIVQEINSSAFKNKTTINSVSFPNSLERINSSAFEGCTNLVGIGFNNGLKTIDTYAFSGCKGLLGLSLPNTLTHINSSAFSGCIGLAGNVTLPNGLTNIGNYAFSGCNNITSFTLPSSVTTIGYQAFENCTKLSSINYPISLTTVSNYNSGQGIFRGCPALTTITIPEGVTSLPAETFNGCTYLTTINLPSTLKTIGNYAFYGCTGLTGTYTLPSGVTSIGVSSFTNCTGLSNIILPNGLTNIGNYAFSGCSNITSFVLPNSVTTIGYQAFENCTKLSNINYPTSLTTVGNYNSGQGIFRGCTSLTTIIVPEGVTALPAETFSGCTYLRTVKLPSTLKTIGNYAFYGCTGFTAFIIPNGVTSIGNYAFYGCYNLMTVSIPPTVSSFGSNVFSNCPKLSINSSMASFATIYAINNNIPYIPTGEGFVDSPSLALDRNGTRYETNYGTMSASGTISVNLQYAIKEAHLGNVSDLKVLVKLPLNTELINNSLTFNGVTVTNFTNDDNNLTIPVVTKSGTIRFAVKPTQHTNIISYAQLSFKKDGSTQSEIIGVVNQNMPLLSIEADGTTASSNIKVSGIAVPGQMVTFHIDGVNAGSIIANKAGKYSTTLSISSPKNYKNYIITANSNNITAETRVKYQESAPVLTEFIMTYNGETYNLSNTENAKPTITFVNGKPFTYTIKFQNAGNIEKVYIISDRNNILKKLEARWDPSAQRYIANGFFDPNDHNYVPGVISVQYIEKGLPFLFKNEIDFTSDMYVNNLPSALEGADIEIYSSAGEPVARMSLFTISDNLLEGRIAPKDIEDLFDFKIFSEKIPSWLNPENVTSEGYVPVKDDAGVQVYMKTAEYLDGKIHSQVLDFAEDKLMDYFIDKGSVTGISALEGFGMLSDAFSMMDKIVTYQNRNVDIKDARNSVLSSNRTESEKQEALRRLDAAQIMNNDTIVIMALTTVLAVSGIGLPFGCGMILTALSCRNKMDLEGILGDVSGFSSRQSIGTSLTFRWAIDPSGYVYEGVTSNRLTGVKATAYTNP